MHYRSLSIHKRMRRFIAGRQEAASQRGDYRNAGRWYTLRLLQTARLTGHA